MFGSLFFYVFVVFAAIQLFYLLFFSKLFVLSKKTESSDSNKAISVIIHAKNNLNELKENLEYILNQNHSKFEVIIVDNDSFDDTIDYLSKIKTKYENLKIVPVENNEAFWGNRKYALTLGIKASKYNYVALTTPSTRPLSNEWLQQLSSEFSDKKKLILGVSKPSGKGFFANLFVRYDAILRDVFSFGWASFGQSFLASDSNYAFDKNEFYRVKGFITHVRNDLSVTSLFTADALLEGNIGFSMDEKSFVKKEKPLTFSNWMKLKRQRFAELSFSSFLNKFSYYFYFISKTLFITFGILSIFFGYSMETYWIFGNYFFLWMLASIFLLKKFRDLQIIYILPILDILFSINEISNFIVYFISKRKY